jgi:hypothetical protein
VSVKEAINRGRPLISDEKTLPLMRPLLALGGGGQAGMDRPQVRVISH